MRLSTSNRSVTAKEISKSFWGINIAQFLGALNDNVYKLLIVYYLIVLQGEGSRDTILAISGALFVLPFITCSAFAGKLADNFSKTHIFQFAKVLEIVVMLFGLLAFKSGNPLYCYLTLMAMSLQSTIFGPAKNGMIPEVFEEKDIAKINGWLTLFSYTGITLGSTIASVLSDWTNENFVLCGVVCVIIAVVGAISSIFVPKTPSSGIYKSHSANVIKEVLYVLSRARKIDKMILMMSCYSLFYLFASFAQLSLVSYAMDSMHLSKTAGGYLNTFIGLGIGMGSMVAGRVANSFIRLDLLPWAGAGVGIGLTVLGFIGQYPLFVMAMILFTGFLGGQFLVPLDTFIQTQSPKEDRGEMIAVTNIFAFTGVLLGSFLIFLLGSVLKISISTSYILTGLSTIACCFVLSNFLGKDSAINLSNKK